MRIVLAALAALLLANTAQAQRVYHQGELDAMLAPIALQPDGVVSQVLIASTYPDEVAAAARWSRANPHLRGDDAVRAVQNEPWDPSVKALTAFPELLIRMDESPQWLHDLGEAFLRQQAQVMDTVQALRQRAQAAGNLASTDQYTVYPQGEAIVVEPRTQIVYVRYYDPYVVYGSWWWPHYHPVFWRPWAPRPVFLAHGFFHTKPDWHGRHVHVVNRGKWQPQKHVVVKPHVRVPESQRRPIVQQHMPAANGFSHARPRQEARGDREQQVRPQMTKRSGQHHERQQAFGPRHAPQVHGQARGWQNGGSHTGSRR